MHDAKSPSTELLLESFFFLAESLQLSPPSADRCLHLIEHILFGRTLDGIDGMMALSKRHLMTERELRDWVIYNAVQLMCGRRLEIPYYTRELSTKFDLALFGRIANFVEGVDALEPWEFEHREFTSPVDDHVAVVRYRDHLRSGDPDCPGLPPYFSLQIDDTFLGDRNFDGTLLWSNQMPYFAIEEWRTTDYEFSPLKRLVVFAPGVHRQCIVSADPVEGHIRIKEFDGCVVSFEELWNNGAFRKIDREIELLRPRQWASTY